MPAHPHDVLRDTRTHATCITATLPYDAPAVIRKSCVMIILTMTTLTLSNLLRLRFKNWQVLARNSSQGDIEQADRSSRLCLGHVRGLVLIHHPLAVRDWIPHMHMQSSTHMHMHLHAQHKQMRRYIRFHFRHGCDSPGGTPWRHQRLCHTQTSPSLICLLRHPTQFITTLHDLSICCRYVIPMTPSSHVCRRCILTSHISPVTQLVHRQCSPASSSAAMRLPLGSSVSLSAPHFSSTAA